MNECCTHLFREAKKELEIKDKKIALLESEVTRVFEPTRQFWNHENETKIKELETKNTELESKIVESGVCESLHKLNIERLQKRLEIAVEGLRFIRSSADCRNEAEQEQCAHAAERTLAAIKSEGL